VSDHPRAVLRESGAGENAVDIMFRRTVLPWFLAAIIATVAAGGEGQGKETERDLGSLAAEALSLSSEPNSATARFQFQYRRQVFLSPDRPAHIAMIVERSHHQAGLLLLRGDGVPYAHFTRTHLVFPDAEGSGKLLALQGCAFAFRCAGLSDFATRIVRYSPGAGRATIELDVAALLGDIEDSFENTGFNSRTLTWEFRNANDSRATIRLWRERRPHQFPVASVILRNKAGEYAALTDFSLREVPIAISTPHATIEGLAQPVTADELAAAHGSLEKAVGWLLDPEVVATICNNARYRQTGYDFLASFPVAGRFTENEAALLRRLLAELEEGSNAHSGDPAEWLKPLAQVNTLLYEKVIGPAQVILERPTGVVRFVTGYDRRRTARMLQMRAGPRLARRLYDVLAAVSTDAKLGEEQRAVAIDMLGAIGVPEESDLLDSIASDIEDPPPDLVRLALASARARTGDPTDADVELLRAAAADPATEENWRSIWLESLLLMDEARGMETIIEKVLSAGETWTGHAPATRCPLAAGCSDEGRNVLLRLAQRRADEPRCDLLMAVLSTAIMPGDRQWGEWLPLARELALDESLAAESRWIAADVAAREMTDEDFRGRFIRSALRSDDTRLVGRLLLDYLGPARSAYKYAREFQSLFKSPDAELRRAAVVVFVVTCSPKPPREYEDAVVRVVKMMLGDADRDVRMATWRLFEEIAEKNPNLLQRLLPDLVQLAHNAEDPSEFMHSILCISALSQGSLHLALPFNPLDDQGRVRTDPEARELIEQHRAEIQRTVDEWLRNRRLGREMSGHRER